MPLCPHYASAALLNPGPAILLYTVLLAPSGNKTCGSFLHVHNAFKHEICASLTFCFVAHRADWNREKAMHSNYASNRFQSDPNGGFGRNAVPKKVAHCTC